MAREYTPSVIQRYAFSRTVADGVSVVIGGSGNADVTVGYVIAGVGSGAPIYWEVKNDSAVGGANLDLKPGPATTAFAAATVSAMANFVTLEPKEGWSAPKRHIEQEFSPSRAPIDAVLMLRGSGGVASFSGFVDVWFPGSVT